MRHCRRSEEGQGQTGRRVGEKDHCMRCFVCTRRARSFKSHTDGERDLLIVVFVAG